MYIEVTLALITAYFIIKIINVFLNSDKRRLLFLISKYKGYIFCAVGLLILAAIILMLDNSYGHRKSIKFASAIAFCALISVLSGIVSAIRNKSNKDI